MGGTFSWLIENGILLGLLNGCLELTILAKLKNDERNKSIGGNVRDRRPGRWRGGQRRRNSADGRWLWFERVGGFFLTVESPTPFFFLLLTRLCFLHGGEKRKGGACVTWRFLACLKGVHYCSFFR